MSDIMLSYAREDRPVAERLARALESRGWSVWWDRRIPAGKTFDETLEAAIAAARCIVVLWSGKSVASRWVRSEAEEGAARNILIPVLIEAVQVPLAFRRIQAADLVGWRGGEADEAFERLVTDLRQLLGPPPVPSEADSSAAAESEPQVGVHEPAKLGQLSPRRIAVLALVVVAVIAGLVTLTKMNEPTAPSKLPTAPITLYEGSVLRVTKLETQVQAENLSSDNVAIRISWDGKDPDGTGAPGSDTAIREPVEPAGLMMRPIKNHTSVQVWAWRGDRGLVDCANIGKPPPPLLDYNCASIPKQLQE